VAPGATPAYADALSTGADLSDCFDFSLPPSRFKRISAPLGRDYFLSQPVSNDDPDDDW